MEYTLENKYDLIRKYVPYGAEFYTKFYTKSANIIKEKRKNRNFLRFFWCSRRESNPQLPLRRGLLYPFNYGSVINRFNFIWKFKNII